MSWALEEYTEDAIMNYLTAKVTAGTMNFYAAWDNEEIKYPCSVIHAGVSRNVSGIAFNGIREIDVQIAVMTDAKDSTTQTARERNRTARDSVLTALAMTALHDDLNAMAPHGVVFSLAMIGQIARSVETERRVFVSEINLETIAAPRVVV